MDRNETVLRKTLHHPLIYILVFIIVSVAAGNLATGFGAAIITWFVTSLLP